MQVIDSNNATATSSVTFTVSQTLTGLAMVQSGAAVSNGNTKTFSVSATDQFGEPMSTPGGVTWSVSSGLGSVSSGIYTAPSSGSGTAIVTASFGAVSATVPVVYGYVVGNVFTDTNSNGVRDTGEKGIAGWELYIDENRNGALDSGETTFFTDADGNYAFNRESTWDDTHYVCGCGPILRAVNNTLFTQTLGTCGSIIPIAVGSPPVVPPPPAATPVAVAPKFQPEAVDFRADNMARFHPVRIDGTSFVGTTDQWQDSNHNGVPTDPGENNFPICYTRSTAVGGVNVLMNLHVNLYSKGGAAIPAGSYQIKADVTVENHLTNGSEGKWHFAAASASISTYNNRGTNDPVLVADLTNPDFVIPGTVGIKVYYLRFSVSNDAGATWVDAGTTGTKAFITMVDPATSWSYTGSVLTAGGAADTIPAPLETVLEIGCRGDAGLSTPNTAAANAIWSIFADERPDGVLSAHSYHMAYWSGGQNDLNASNPDWLTDFGLIRIQDGPCEAWSGLLVDVLRTQGMYANVYGIFPSQSAVKPSPGGIVTAPVGFPTVRGFSVNTQLGQGTNGAAWVFNGHAVVEFGAASGGSVYDPSYGAYYATEVQWQDTVLKDGWGPTTYGFKFTDAAGAETAGKIPIGTGSLLVTVTKAYQPVVLVSPARVIHWNPTGGALHCDCRTHGDSRYGHGQTQGSLGTAIVHHRRRPAADARPPVLPQAQ